MKLFTKEQTKSAKDIQLTKDISRTQTVKMALSDSQRDLDDLNAQFEVKLSKQRIIWAQEEKSFTDRIAPLVNEIQKLEKEREVLLIPIDIERQRAYSLMEEADKALSEANRKRDENESVAVLLQDRLDAVSDSAEELKKREDKCVSRESNLAMKEETIQKMSQSINKQAQDFLLNSTVRDRELSERENTLNTREINLESRESICKANEDFLIKEKQSILSQRQALQAAQKLFNK